MIQEYCIYSYKMACVSLDNANMNIKFDWNINFTTLTAANILSAFVVIILYFTPLQIVLNAMHEKNTLFNSF